MATRFGGRSPFETYVAKVRWLVGGLLGIIVVLTASVTYIAASTTTETDVRASHAETKQEDNARAYVDVLATVRRVESGEVLDESMFSRQPFPSDAVPDGLVLASDIKTLRGKYAGGLLRAGFPVSYDSVKLTPPFNVLDIPEGYRAVTIQANARELVAGHVTPNSRVDVLWRHKDRRGRMRIKPVVRFAKILSVDGDTHNRERSKVSNKGTTATLLVTAREAQMVELARGLGNLSLVLLGPGDNGEYAKNSSEVSEDELYGETDAEETEIDAPGKAYVPDPVTGRIRRYLLTDRWRIDSTYQ